MWSTVYNLQDQKGKCLLPFFPKWHGRVEIHNQQKKQKDSCETCQTGAEGPHKGWLRGRVTAFLKFWCSVKRKDFHIIFGNF